MMIDKKLLKFLNFENRMYLEVVNDERHGFTDEFQKRVIKLIRDIMVSTGVAI